MFVAGALSGRLGIGSGALKVLALDQAMGLSIKVSTTTSTFMIGVTAACAGVHLQRCYDKVAAVEYHVAQYVAVAMVGDGLNEAPALARATLGVAMEASGTEAAIETADIALMADDLTRLAWLVRNSRRTIAVICQNIVFSLGSGHLLWR